MILCKRCQVQPATYRAAGLLMCESCAKAMEWRFKTPITLVGAPTDPSPVQQASLNDLTPLGVAVPSLGAAEVLSDGSIRGPDDAASVGNLKSDAGKISSSAKGAVSSVTTSVTETARTVRTIVIIGGVIGIGVIAYTMYNAQRTTARAMDILERHPDLLVKGGVLV